MLSLLFYNLATVNYGQTCNAFHAEDIHGLVASSCDVRVVIVPAAMKEVCATCQLLLIHERAAIGGQEI